jgi:hypothetical protein
MSQLNVEYNFDLYWSKIEENLDALIGLKNTKTIFGTSNEVSKNPPKIH